MHLNLEEQGGGNLDAGYEGDAKLGTTGQNSASILQISAIVALIDWCHFWSLGILQLGALSLVPLWFTKTPWISLWF